MIFISVGTVSFPFKRLVDEMIDYSANEHVVIQSGIYKPTHIPHTCTLIPYLSYQETCSYYSQANRVISAAGEASCILMLQYCKYKPILFPRQKKFHEHVDDQQIEIAQAMAKLHLTEVATTTDELRQVLSKPPQPNNGLVIPSTHRQLLDHLHQITRCH